MSITYKNLELKYLDELHELSCSNSDVLKPNTKMLYFIIGNYFSNISTLISNLENNLSGINIEFSVKESNLNAIRLYESLGYKKGIYNEQIDQVIYSKKVN